MDSAYHKDGSKPSTAKEPIYADDLMILTQKNCGDKALDRLKSCCLSLSRLKGMMHGLPHITTNDDDKHNNRWISRNIHYFEILTLT